MSIKDQVSLGIKWASVSIFLVRATRFLTSIVLARLLAPEMFGIVAMANVAIDTMGVISQVGIGSAYIYRRFGSADEKRRAENTIFFASIAISAILFIACFTLSPLLARFFNSSQLEGILRVMVISFLLDPFATLPSFILLKKLAFGRQSKCEIAQALSYALVGVSLAFLGLRVWSLVCAQLASNLVFAVLGCAVSGWRPRLEFDVGLAKELFGYGKFLWACSLVSAFGGAIDRAVIGRFWGAGSLGYYHVAFSLSKLPSDVLSNMFAKVTFPAFSRLNRERDRLKNAVLRTISAVTFAAVPMGFGLFAVSEPFVAAVYGSTWRPSVPLIEVLAFCGTIQCIAPITGNVLKAVGSPRTLFALSVFHHMMLVALLVLLRGEGTVGICYALVISTAVSAAVSFALVNRLLAVSLREFADPLVRSLASGGIMAVAVRSLQRLLAEEAAASPLQILALSILAGAVVYAGAALVLNRTVLANFKETLIDVLRSTEAGEADDGTAPCLMDDTELEFATAPRAEGAEPSRESRKPEGR